VKILSSKVQIFGYVVLCALVVERFHQRLILYYKVAFNHHFDRLKLGLSSILLRNIENAFEHVLEEFTKLELHDLSSFCRAQLFTLNSYESVEDLFDSCVPISVKYKKDKTNESPKHSSPEIKADETFDALELTSTLVLNNAEDEELKEIMREIDIPKKNWSGSHSSFSKSKTLMEIMEEESQKEQQNVSNRTRRPSAQLSSKNGNLVFDACVSSICKPTKGSPKWSNPVQKTNVGSLLDIMKEESRNPHQAAHSPGAVGSTIAWRANMISSGRHLLDIQAEQEAVELVQRHEEVEKEKAKKERTEDQNKARPRKSKRRSSTQNVDNNNSIPGKPSQNVKNNHQEKNPKPKPPSNKQPKKGNQPSNNTPSKKWVKRPES
jgi:hypothetical protein